MRYDPDNGAPLLASRGEAAQVVNAQASRTALTKYTVEGGQVADEDMDLLLNQDPPCSGLV